MSSDCSHFRRRAKERLRLAVVLSPDEVQRLIASASNLYHRTLLLTLDGAGHQRRLFILLLCGPYVGISGACGRHVRLALWAAVLLLDGELRQSSGWRRADGSRANAA
jgi:hypothetical protein